MSLLATFEAATPFATALATTTTITSSTITTTITLWAFTRPMPLLATLKATFSSFSLAATITTTIASPLATLWCTTDRSTARTCHIHSFDFAAVLSGFKFNLFTFIQRTESISRDLRLVD
mmetsp:Transcript_45276/g.80957  ORF Transcript_45276/g.80957 Transcript_45276/m.80957 type:complete len:120 (-) Transcript_45276:1409-1768(-)